MTDKKTEAPETPAYLNTELSPKERAKDIVSRMTLQEKAWQVLWGAPGIDRLGVAPHNWWNECLHGVARAGIATVFPQAIGLGATWDTGLIREMADVISDEARAKHHEFVRQGDYGWYKGLTFWSPNINIFRDPRWGRGHETYGEDPCLTGKIGVAFVKGLQGDDPKYLKIVATPKHYAVHSGPEKDRHHFDAESTPKDMRETYLPAFKMCVQEGGAVSVMGAYNRTNGEPCCGSKTLLQDILRDEWGFDGYVVSDCGAICDFHNHHKITANAAESAAMAMKNGCDLNCGDAFTHVMVAHEAGLLSEEEITTAVERLFEARIRLGMFDPQEEVPYTKIRYEINDCEEHRALARKVAQKSIVLLKNANNLLPLKKDLKSIAVIGPNADSLDVLLGNYYGQPSKYVTALEGIRNAISPSTRLFYAKGCELTGDSDFFFTEAISAAERAEVVIMCMGISPKLEGEEGEIADSDGGGDRLHINLPGKQQELVEKIAALGKPVVLVLMNGSALAINWAQENVPAILTAWYPGQEGGNALADALFGEVSPAGRLPVTFVKSLEQLPDFTDYSMKNRTYKYIESDPLYPFGFGLSYTSFAYSGPKLSAGQVTKDTDLQVTVQVENTGKTAGDEVVELYLSDLEASVTVPTRQLIAFKRITLAAGEKQELTFTITPRQMALIDNDGKAILEPGKFRLTIGGSQGDARSLELGAAPVATAEFEVTGEKVELPY